MLTHPTASGLSAVESLAAWLSERTDDELIALLKARPDIALPAPSSMLVLANRALQRPSLMRAMDDLNSAALALLDILTASDDTLERAALQARVSDQLTTASLDHTLEHLQERALVWGNRILTVAPGVADGLPWLAGTVAGTVPVLSEHDIESRLTTVDDSALAIANGLAANGPLGRTRDALPGADPERPIQQLIAADLVYVIEGDTVAINHQTAQYLRGEPLTNPHTLTAPRIDFERIEIGRVNATAAGEAMEFLRHCHDVLAILETTPTPTLKAGGLGVREMRRLAKLTNIVEARIALVLEVLAGAALITSGVTDSGDEIWAPTPAADTWLESDDAQQWNLLATTWFRLPRRIELVGASDGAKSFAAMSPELYSPSASIDREAVLGTIAELPTGSAPSASEIAQLVGWRRPRLARRLRPEAISAIDAEATALGILALNAMSSAGRAIAHGSTDAHAEMAAAFPPALDKFVVQADLTVMVPGRPTPQLRAELSDCANLESAGGASVYRVDESTIRRALDVGHTATDLRDFFEVHASAALPQSLTYLIDDVARRHGQIRVGIAGCFVRCDDPALVKQVLSASDLSGLDLRALAPTVLISTAEIDEVLSALRVAGFAPAAEDASGAILSIKAPGLRIRPPRRSPVRQPTHSTEDQVRASVDQLRASHNAEQLSRGSTSRAPIENLEILRAAVANQRRISIGYVDAGGRASYRIVDPVRVGSGSFDAYDPVSKVLRNFALHRITTIAQL